jgi:beta-lactamase regulating signal transducer with metallopeptidase domain
MSPEVYLQFAAGFVGYFLKVAVAWLLCWLLTRIISGPRQRFAVWLGFTLSSLAYWIYVLTTSFSVQSVAIFSAKHPASAFPRIGHEFLVAPQFRTTAAWLGHLIIYIYLGGVLLLLALAAWKRARIHFLLRHSSAPSDKLKALFAELCRQFGIRNCELLVLPGLSSPATVRWWRPRILLPDSCEQLGDDAAMADILNHELAHVARRDYLWSIISDSVCQIVFFHPAMWQARKQMRIQREMACDLAVVAAWPEHRADYAHTLTRVARLYLDRGRSRLRIGRYSITGIDFAASPSLLTHRVRAILNDPQKFSWGQKFIRATTSAVLVAGYGFFCAALAIVIAFAPAPSPATVTEAHSPSSSLRNDLRQASRHERTTHPQEQSLITESPAYRLGAAPGSAHGSAVARTSSAENSGPEVAGSAIPNWKQHPASRSPGDTIESIIVATVGAVIGASNDDEHKHHANH